MKNAIIGLCRDSSQGLFYFLIAFIILIYWENISLLTFSVIGIGLGWVAGIISSPLFIGIMLLLIFLALIG